MALNAAFIFISPEGEPNTHQAKVVTGSVDVTTFAVKSYTAACQLAKTLVADGFNAIELCGGFGIEGVAAVKQAVNNTIPVGVVRFDNHPGLGFKSGDDLFE